MTASKRQQREVAQRMEVVLSELKTAAAARQKGGREMAAFVGTIKGAAVKFKPPTKKSDGYHVLVLSLNSTDDPQAEYENLSELVGERVAISITREQVELPKRGEK